MPVSTRNMVARALQIGVVKQNMPLRRSTRIARAEWLARLRPRIAPVKQRTCKQQRPCKQQRRRAVPGVVPRRSARLLSKALEEWRNVAAPEPKAVKPEETFTMSVNPMFFATTAPRSCTGWSCCCAAPNGFGPGRTNWCKFYSLEPMPAPAGGARTPPLSELLALTKLPPLPVSPPLSPLIIRQHATSSLPPALSERTMNMILNTVGVPVKPQTPPAECTTH